MVDSAGQVEHQGTGLPPGIMRAGNPLLVSDIGSNTERLSAVGDCLSKLAEACARRTASKLGIGLPCQPFYFAGQLQCLHHISHAVVILA
jgi:hypothetical protein